MKNTDKINEIYNIIVYDTALKQMPENSKLTLNGVVLANKTLTVCEVDNYKKVAVNLLINNNK